MSMEERPVPGGLGAEGQEGASGEEAHGGRGGRGGQGGLGTAGEPGPRGLRGPAYSSFLTRHAITAYVLLALGLLAAIGLSEYRTDQTTKALCVQASANRQSLRQLVVAITEPSLSNPATPPDRRELAQRFRDEQLVILPPLDCSTGELVPTTTATTP